MHLDFNGGGHLLESLPLAILHAHTHIHTQPQPVLWVENSTAKREMWLFEGGDSMNPSSAPRAKAVRRPLPFPSSPTPPHIQTAWRYPRNRDNSTTATNSLSPVSSRARWRTILLTFARPASCPPLSSSPTKPETVTHRGRRRNVARKSGVFGLRSKILPSSITSPDRHLGR